MPYLEPLSPALQAACNSSDVAEVRVLSKGLTRGEWSSLLTSATDAGAVEVAAYCLEQGATINYETLYSAAWNAKSEPVYRYMIESGATDVTYPNVFIDRGGDVLGLAADAARHSLVRFMLERGATPNTSLEFRAGRPTLVCAARNSDKEMVELLLDHGANLHGRGVLVAAAGAGKADTVDFLLSRGVDVNEQENRSYLDGPERPINETGECDAPHYWPLAVLADTT